MYLYVCMSAAIHIAFSHGLLTVQWSKACPKRCAQMRRVRGPEDQEQLTTTKGDICVIILCKTYRGAYVIIESL